MVAWDAKDKTFIITGGASGMGARYLDVFINQGAKSIAIWDIAEQQGKTLADKYEKTNPGQVTFIKCDMSKEDEIAKAFEEVLKKFKQIDVIINNAGTMADSPTTWRTAADINFQGVVSLTMKGLSHMDKSENGAGGTIVNIASTAALTKLPFVPIYSGAKCAVMHFSRCLAMDPFYSNTGVRILCICFGLTDTPILHNLGKRVYTHKLAQEFEAITPENGFYYQKVESAISSVEHMLKNGDCGSIWLSVNDRPVKDITGVVEQAWGLLERQNDII